VIVWWLDLQLHVYKEEKKLGADEVVIVWWLDLQLHIYKDENKLGAVEGRDRMGVRFTATCI
jgi:predicted GNAT superfamily acetyltransferase